MNHTHKEKQKYIHTHKVLIKKLTTSICQPHPTHTLGGDLKTHIHREKNK